MGLLLALFCGESIIKGFEKNRSSSSILNLISINGNNLCLAFHSSLTKKKSMQSCVDYAKVFIIEQNRDIFMNALMRIIDFGPESGNYGKIVEIFWQFYLLHQLKEKLFPIQIKT